MAGLLEQLSADDQAKVKSWREQAQNPKHQGDIPPELFICAKLGFYYGWDAMLAFKLGYIIGYDDEMKPVKIPYTFDEAVADVKSAEKVNYRNIIDQGDIIASANISSRDKQWAKGVIDYSNKIRKDING